MVNMVDLEPLDPYFKEGQGRCNLTHFAWRFPSYILTNNCRVDQGYSKLSHQLLSRIQFSTERIARDDLLRACLDIDEYLESKQITLEKVDEAIAEFRKTDFQSENPADYLPFSKFCEPIYLYLINKKEHNIDNLIG